MILKWIYDHTAKQVKIISKSIQVQVDPADKDKQTIIASLEGGVTKKEETEDKLNMTIDDFPNKDLVC